MQNKKKPPARGKGRQFSFKLGTSALVLCIGLAMLMLVWAFILGVLVGRGYYPEGMLDSLGAGGAAQKKEAAENPAGDGEPQVLRPEELGFFDALQQEWDQGFQELNPRTQSKPPQAQPAEQVQEPETAQVQEKEAEQERFAYIYQVAAFQRQDQAQGLQEKLNGAGIESYIQEVDKAHKRWYRVYVSYVGTPQENQQLQSKLQDLGLDKSFVRSKKPF